MKTNVFIKLNYPFEVKCPTIKTTFIRSFIYNPSYFAIRTQEPERITEIIEMFNQGKYETGYKIT